MNAADVTSLSSTPARPLRVERLGTEIPYGPMLALQKQRHNEVLTGTCDPTLFILQHARVITAGRNAKPEHILAGPQRLAAAGVEHFEAGRGGDVTYHGPGQVVGYPIIHLQGKERDVRGYVHALEEVMIATAADFGITAQREDGKRGVWVGNAKIGAIGVRLSRWTTMHGFALNITTDLRDFGLIVPCGLRDSDVTSISALLGRTLVVGEVEDRLVYHCARVLDRQPYEATPTPWQQETDDGAIGSTGGR